MKRMQLFIVKKSDIDMFSRNKPVNEKTIGVLYVPEMISEKIISESKLKKMDFKTDNMNFMDIGTIYNLNFEDFDSLMDVITVIKRKTIGKYDETYDKNDFKDYENRMRMIVKESLGEDFYSESFIESIIEFTDFDGGIVYDFLRMMDDGGLEDSYVFLRVI